MSLTIRTRSSSTKVMAGAALSLLMVFQAFGPGVFALKTAFAASTDDSDTTATTTVPCLTPAATSTKIDSFGVPFGGEITLQQVLDNQYDVNAINTATDDTGIESWNIPTGTNSVTFDGTFVKSISGDANEFGYYFDGDKTTFVPVFKTAGHTGTANILADGQAIPSFTVNTTGHTSIAFAIDNQDATTNDHTIFATQSSVNSSSEDHAVVYNTPSNAKSFIIAFEDLPFPVSDKDYQDLVVQINMTSCTNGGTSCTASSGTIASDTNTSVTSIDGSSMNASSTLVTPTSITDQAWTATTTDPNAKWIWSEDPVSGWTVDKTVTFSKTFALTGTPHDGSIMLAADNTYDIQVNGHEIGSDQSGAYSTFENAQTYSIPASDFVTGINTLTVTVKNLAQGDNTPTGQLDNPAGLIYTLSYSATCDGGSGGGNNSNIVQVHIAKYLDGVQATAAAANSYAFPMSATWNYVDKTMTHQSGTGSYTLNPSGFGPSDQVTPAYEASTDYMQSGATYSTWEVTKDTDATSQVYPYGADCKSGSYELEGYGISDTSFADAFAHVQAPTGPSDHPDFSSGVNHDEYVVVANHTCSTIPTGSATGTLEITKYECPADTTVTRTDNGVGGSAPAGCTLEAGATFGYVHGTQTDSNAPYPELGATITEAGSTNKSGVLDVNLDATGRYLVMETDGSGTQLAASDILGLYCDGDGDTSGSNDNQELTFVSAGKTTNCVGYNKATTTVATCDGDCDATSTDPTDPGTSGGDIPTIEGCGSTCNTFTAGISSGPGGGGGGGRFFAPAALGASTNNSNGEVLGASTDLPNLPDTGNGSASDSLLTLAILALALVAINMVAVNVLKRKA